MSEMLEKTIHTQQFFAADAKTKCVEWIKKTFDEIGPDCKAVVGISGGKDSTIVAALCVEALGIDSVVGVLMPCVDENELREKLAFNALSVFMSSNNYVFRDTSEDEISKLKKLNSAAKAQLDGYEVCKLLGIHCYCVNIKNIVDSVIRPFSYSEMRLKLSDQALINILPRVRMTVLYAISQSLYGRVANTSNLSEIFLGYSTRWGDSVGDFAPLANLTATEVKAIGHELALDFGLPEYLIEKTPDDGLTGKSDEDNFGFTYEELDKFIRTGLCPNDNVRNLIIDRHQKNLFKSKPIVSFDWYKTFQKQNLINNDKNKGN